MNHSLKQRVYLYQVVFFIIFYVDVPFINGNFIAKGAFMNMREDDIECDESKLVFGII